MRNGKIVYYAMVNGYGKPPVEGTLAQVEIALGLGRKKKTFRAYTVHIEKKYPAWNEVGGFDWDTDAENASDAVKQARKYMADNGLSGRQEGPITYRARLKNQANESCLNKPGKLRWMNS